MFSDIPLFAGLDPEARGAIEAGAIMKSFPKGAVVITQDDDSRSMYLVLGGHLRVYRTNEDGKEIILGFLNKGDYFGELAVLDPAPRSASVMVLQPSRLAVLSREHVIQCLEQQPRIAINLLASLAARFRSADRAAPLAPEYMYMWKNRLFQETPMMNAPRATLLIGLFTTLPLVATPVVAQEQPSPQATNPTRAASQAPIYKPPMRGAPATRTGGASRGKQNSSLILSVLAPESTGLTSRAQPTLYWYSSKGLAAPLEFTLNDDQSIKPLVETKTNASRPGIHALRLNYPLKPEVEYQWAIAAVADPDQRAGDIIASGTIKRVQPSAALAAKLSGASQSQLPFLYAEAGFWYDAIATLSEQIDANPADRGLREQRADLLDQVGLTAPAAYDRGARP